MSKSKGEFLTVSLLEEKGYDPLIYRLFCLQSHYRKSLVFSWEGMDNTKAAYTKLLQKIASLKENDGDIDTEAYDKLTADFKEALDNDLNTSLAVTVLYDVLKAKTNDATKRKLIADFDTVLSLSLLEKAAELAKAAKDEAAGTAPDIDPQLAAKIESMIAERAEAKAAKNYARADEIRAELTAMGVTLKDSKEGTTYTIG